MSLSLYQSREGFIWPEKPNWRSPVTETLEYQTSLLPSRSGRRYPAALRVEPRITVRYASDAIDLKAERSLLESSLLPVNDLWVLPHYWREVPLASDPVATGTSLSLTEAKGWIVAGVKLVLMDDSGMEAVTVSISGGTSITLTAPIIRSYSGAKAYLATDARPQKESTIRAAMTRHISSSTNMLADPALYPGWTSSYWPSSKQMSYRTRPVALFDPNWRQENTVQFKRPVEVQDVGRGSVSSVAYREHVDIVFGHLFTGMAADDVDALMQFFRWARGRQGRFWAPIPVNALSGAVGTAGATSFITDSYGIDTLSSYSTIGHLLITWPGGCKQAVKITGTSNLGNQTASVTIEETLVFDVTPDCRIEFLLLVGFATDAMEVSWITDTVAEVPILLHSERIEIADIENGPLVGEPYDSETNWCP